MFAGSIMTLGTDAQKKTLIESQKKGVLGCFMLTEYAAGVTSGMIVNTRADIMENGKIMINTPGIVYDSNKKIDFERTLNRKNWISQGLTAKWGVVVARLYSSNNSDLGIFPFMINMKDEHIHKKDNGLKTGINSLDNAQIIFDGLIVEKDSIMFDRLDKIIKDIHHDPKFGFMRIASRLNSGRLCIADSLSDMVMRLIDRTKKGSLDKDIYLNQSTQIKLYELPELQDLLLNMERRMLIIRIFIDSVKREYCNSIRTKKYNLSNDLIHKIMVAKIIAIDYSIEVMNTLRRKIGSSALFARNNLGSNLDILLCGRFAEGDNDILIRKLVMDKLKDIMQDNMVINFFRLYIKPIKDMKDEENYRLLQFAEILYKDGSDKVITFNRNYETIKTCSELICYNIVQSNLPQDMKTHIDLKDIRAML